jgi:glycosyltransferase involved in cell wall biosynthesis
MAFGVPVVTNSASLEGFSVTPGREVMVGDDPVAFARGVVSLLRDPALHSRVSEEGWKFVKANYSLEAIAARLSAVVEAAGRLQPKKLAAHRRLARGVRVLLDQHVLWRLRRVGGGA